MGRGIPHFRVPLNLPHAATITGRIVYHLRRTLPADANIAAANLLFQLMLPYQGAEGNPPEEAARRVVEEAAVLARSIVDEIERLEIGDDRLGQAVRNFFECLELGEEGAVISLRAGENPDSALRPR